MFFTGESLLKKVEQPLLVVQPLTIQTPTQMASLRRAGQSSKVRSHMMYGVAEVRRAPAVKTNLAAGATQKATGGMFIPRNLVPEVSPQAQKLWIPKKKTEQRSLPPVCPFPVLWLLTASTEICHVQPTEKPTVNLII